MKTQNQPNFRRMTCAAAVVLLGLSFPASADVISLNAAGNSAIDSYYYSTNWGVLSASNPQLTGDAGNTSPNGATEIDRELFNFNLSSIPTGATINSATLRLAFTGNNPAMSTTLSLYSMNESWTQNTVTWQTTDGTTSWGTPGTASPVDHQATPTTSLTSIFGGSNTSRVDTSFTGLTSDVQNWLNNPSSNFGWILINSDEVDKRTAYPYPDKQFFASGWTIANGQSFDAQPILDVTYTVAPEPASVAMLILGGVFGGIALRVRKMRSGGAVSL